MFRRILAATDMVLTGDPPVFTGARLARQYDASLFVLHVMESASTENRYQVRHFETGKELMADPSYGASIRQHLETAYKDHLNGVPCEISIRAGFPWEEILKWARQIDCDLIILGPHASRAEERGVIRVAGKVGSTVENVLTRENCPVMIVNRPLPEQNVNFNRVLVTIDFSSSCECAVRFAASFAKHHDCTLLVLHIIPVPPYPKYSRKNYEADVHHTQKRMASLFDGYLDGIEHQYAIGAGALPHLEILKYAEKNSVDLIFLGSHTKERSGKWYPGSVVERVGFRTVCPVMVITDPEVLSRWDGTIPSDAHKTSDNDRLIHVFTHSE